MTKRRAPNGSLVTLMNPWLRRYPVLRPVVLQHRPQHLVDIFTATPGRASQNALLHGAELSERAVRASVLQQHARLEPMRADRAERKRADRARGFEKDPGAAGRRRQRRFPLGR